jgi:hypothetical protein
MGLSLLEIKCLHSIVAIDGLLHMIENKENVDNALTLVRELMDDCQQEASKRDGRWKERIGITHDWLRV